MVVTVEVEDDACSAECERAQSREASHARALRDTSASPPWTRARDVDARRSAPRDPAATSTHILCDRPPETFRLRGRTGAPEAPHDALAPIPPRVAETEMGTPRERTGIAIAPFGGRPCVRERRFALRIGWVFRTRGFLARFLTTASPTRRAKNRQLGQGSPRALRTAGTVPSCRGSPATYGVRRGVCGRGGAVRTKTRPTKP